MQKKKTIGARVAQEVKARDVIIAAGRVAR